MPGEAKTRLAPLLGSQGAACFQAALLCDAVRKVALLRGVARYLFFVGGTPLASMNGSSRREVAGYALLPQQGADLGERLSGAFRQMLERHPSALIIGTDSPTLGANRMRQALRELSCCEAVLGPCPDGGYYLIGLRRFRREMFRGVRWGTRFAFRDTLRNLIERHFSCSILEPLPDVDRPTDLQCLAKSLSRSPELRRLAPATWSFVKEAGARRSALMRVR